MTGESGVKPIPIFIYYAFVLRGASGIPIKGTGAALYLPE
jgi:hypothetical protein